MNNAVLMLLVLGLLAIAILSPFSALALLMIVVLVSALFWTVVTLAKTLILGDASKKS